RVRAATLAGAPSARVPIRCLLKGGRRVGADCRRGQAAPWPSSQKREEPFASSVALPRCSPDDPAKRSASNCHQIGTLAKRACQGLLARKSLHFARREPHASAAKLAAV